MPLNRPEESFSLNWLILVFVCCPAVAFSQSDVVIQNVSVISMTGVRATTRQSVIVRDGRISAIGPSASVRMPAGATIIDGTGKFLIPGLFEMHAHMSKSRASAFPLYVY